jgi:esterase/lipase superfamily enzyme
MERSELVVGAGGGNEIRVVRHGSAGLPLVYVPTSGGDHLELEAYGMAEDARPWVEAGRLHVFAVDGHGPTTIFSDEIPPHLRMAAYARFEGALTGRVVPRIAALAGRPSFDWVGASYGAFVVANVLLRCSEHVDHACGLGGVYGLWHRLGGHHDAIVFEHTPLERFPALDGPALEAVRGKRGFRLYAGGRDPWRDSTERFAAELSRKGVPHELRVWEGADHHEHWWRRQFLELVRDRCGEA